MKEVYGRRFLLSPAQLVGYHCWKQIFRQLSRAQLIFFVSQGLACGHPTQSFRDWLQINLGNFSRNAEYHDLLSWNLYFDGVSRHNLK